jgi:hypothetical protein
MLRKYLPWGTKRVHFVTRPAINPRPGSGNPNLYVKRGAGAYPGDFHRASLNPGAFERITIPNPAPGTYFVTVYGQDAYQDILLRVFRRKMIQKSVYLQAANFVSSSW